MLLRSIWMNVCVPLILARQRQLGTRLLKLGGGTVLAGPFVGMSYVHAAHGSVLPAKLLGTYEQGLHKWVELAIADKYDLIVDIGCAEGYYAVGFAFKMPGVKVWGFDIEAHARILCNELAALNKVGDRLRVDGRCDDMVLQKALSTGTRSLVFSDCEGAEMELLDPAKTPALRHADLLVELHEMIRPGVKNVLLQRFGETHDIEFVADTPAWGKTIKVDPVRKWNWMDRWIATSELRGRGQLWGWFSVKRRL